MKNLDLDNIGNLDESFSNISAEDKAKQDIYFSNTYIDGTTQRGIYIDGWGYCRCSNETEVVDGVTMRKWIVVPKGKGFTKTDGKGNYFYFEELPFIVREEIKRLESLDIQKKKDDNAQKIKDNADRLLAQSNLNKQKVIDAKIALDKKKESDILNSQLKLSEDKSSKNKKIIIWSSIGLVVLVGGFFAIKYFRK